MKINVISLLENKFTAYVSKITYSTVSPIF